MDLEQRVSELEKEIAELKRQLEDRQNKDNYIFSKLNLINCATQSLLNYLFPSTQKPINERLHNSGDNR